MWIILKIDNELFKMINTDVCACFQNVNGELGFEHGNYRHTISTTDIADAQEILDYIAYCLKQKKYICEIPSDEYNSWRSIFIRKKELLKEIKKAPVTILNNEKDYVLTYRGIPVEELQKHYEEYIFNKTYQDLIEGWVQAGFVNPILPEEIKKIKEQEKREEAIKRAIAKAYLFDKKNKK